MSTEVSHPPAPPVVLCERRGTLTLLQLGNGTVALMTWGGRTLAVTRADLQALLDAYPDGAE